MNLYMNMNLYSAPEAFFLLRQQLVRAVPMKIDLKLCAANTEYKIRKLMNFESEIFE